MKLSFAEEMLLLLLDDDDGSFLPVSEWTVQCALAGAVLMDLALANKIDTDLEKLTVVDRTSTGDPILDPVLERLAAEGEARDAKAWVHVIAEDSDDIREKALARLVERGILQRHDERFLWVFQTRRYPTIDGRAEREVKLRIIGVLLSEDIPDPRDIVLICLVDACGMFDELLSERELEAARPRIEQVRKLDLIGQAVARAVQDIQSSVALAMQPTF
jgi:golgi phosphoprotein 3